MKIRSSQNRWNSPVGRGINGSERHKGWVLVIAGGGGRDQDTVAAIRGLAAGGYKAAITVSDTASLAARSRYCARRVRVPDTTDEAYAAAVRAELESGSYLTFLPASEPSLLALGVRVPHLVDKRTLKEAAEAVGFPVPPTTSFPTVEALRSAASNIDYPVVVKPTTRRYQAFCAGSSEEILSREIQKGPVLVQPLVPGQVHVVSGVAWQGNLVVALHEQWLRTHPHPCGLGCASETITLDLDLERRLMALIEGYDGIFNAQLIGDHLIDLNLRVHTSHALTVKAGVNLVATYCDLLRGEKVEMARARPGLFYRWLEGDIRHMIMAVKQGRIGAVSALASLRPRLGTAHSIESLKDPGPMLARLSFAGRRLRSSEGFTATGELR